MSHNELTELDAWLYFLGSDDPQDILRIVEKYPLFRRLYQEIIHFRFHPKELITMYSDALQIMDRNTERYMIDELKEQISQMNATISQKNAAISRKDAEISQKDAEISQKNAEIQRLLAKLAQHENLKE